MLQVSGWPAPFGITLVADLLAAMLVRRGRRRRRRGHGGGIRRRGSEARSVRLPSADPDPVDGRVGRLPHRRPVQPVRVVRGDAGRVVRVDGAAPHQRAGGGGVQVRHDQPDRILDLPHRARAAVRCGRNAQHGRSREARADDTHAGHRHGAGGAVRDCLQHQGRTVPALLLAAGVLSHAARGDRRGVRRPADEGGRLRADADLHAAVPGRTSGAVHAVAGDVGRDDGDWTGRCPERAGFPQDSLVQPGRRTSATRPPASAC